MVVHLLCRRGVVASVTPYRLFGADKGPYVTTEDFFPIASPPPIYKVLIFMTTSVQLEFPFPILYIKQSENARPCQSGVLESQDMFFLFACIP